LIPDYHAFFNQQTHCRALRTAVLLFGRICQSRIEGGHWPTSLERVLSNASPLDLRDPYTDQPFGYLLESGLPLLYSRNLDGVDHAGLDGPWGKEGTDMRVFGPHWGAGVGR